MSNGITALVSITVVAITCVRFVLHLTRGRERSQSIIAEIQFRTKVLRKLRFWAEC
jgi:hypothetical protein